MIDDLIAIVLSFEFEEFEGAIYINSIVWTKHSQLTLGLSVWCEEQEQIWNVSCTPVLAQRISNHWCGSLDVTFDHPILLPHNIFSKGLYISSKAENPAAVFGSLAAAHLEVCGPWYPLRRFMNPHVAAIQLLEGGNGLLAEGPEPLINKFQKVLDEYDVRYTVFSASHGIIAANTEAPVRAVLLDDSYVVAHSFEAARM